MITVRRGPGRGQAARQPAGARPDRLRHRRARGRRRRGRPSPGLKTSYAPGVNHDDVADLALGLIIASRRDIVGGDHRVRTGGWTDERVLTRSLRGQSIGIVGLGRIGESLARRCQAMGLTVRWWAPREQPGQPWPRCGSVLELAAISDILAVCARADDSNRGLISRAVIEALGPRGLLVNVSRGALVDEPALIAALKDGRLGAAALDVFEQEPTPPARWAGAPNVIFTPHAAGATDRSVGDMVSLLLENLAAFFAGRPLKTPAGGLATPDRGGALHKDISIPYALMGLRAEQAVDILRAAGEPSRLRILALLAREELAVMELSRILDQSQPRVSRHLKLLTEAGLIERFADGAWAFFRLSEDEGPRALVDTALSMIDPADVALARDADRLQAVQAERSAEAGAYFARNAARWDEISALYISEAHVEAAVLEAAGPGPFHRLVDLGAGPAIC